MKEISITGVNGSPNKNIKILLIGTGAVSYVLSKFLSKDKNISKIICASNNLKRASSFIDNKNKKIKLINLDASKKEQVMKEAKGVDIIINAALPDFNENVLWAALKVRAHYQDLCSYLKDFKTPEQLKYHNQFKKSKLIALINAGAAPGVTNLLARDIADKLDSISFIKIRLLEEQKANEFVPSWSVQVALDELSAPPLNYSEGKLKLLAPFEDFEEYEFPPPYGKRIAVNIYGDEVSTIPKFIKVKNVDYKSSGADIEFSRILYKLGLLSNKPIKFKNNKIVPLELFFQIAPKVPTPKEMKSLIKNKIIEDSIFISVVEGEGVKSGKRIKIKKSIIYPNLKNIQKIMPGATYISYPAGLAAYTFLKTLSKIKKYGVFPPEALDSEIRKEVLLGLESYGVVINEQFSKA